MTFLPAPPPSVTLGASPRALAIGDLNGDGITDLTTANQSANNVSVLLGNGAGGYGSPSNITVGTGPVAVAIADLNADGKPDLVTANSGAGTVSVLLGNGAGGFAAATSVAVGAGAASIVNGDLNGDGKPDLATANNGANTVSALLRVCPVIAPYALPVGGAKLSVASRSLPAGLTLSPGGAFAGAVTSTGPYSFTVRVVDAEGTPNTRVSAGTVDGVITLAPATAGTAYSAASGFAAGATTFAVSNGALPPGLTLSGAGAISGTPTLPGAYAFRVTADVARVASFNSFTLEIVGLGSLSLVGVTLSPAFAPATRAYTASVSSGTASTTVTPAAPAGMTSAPQTITLSSTGAVPLHVLSATVSGDFGLAGGGCPGTLAPGGACAIAVTFSPSAGGSRTGTLTVTTDGGVLTTPLSGTGTGIVAKSEGGGYAIVGAQKERVEWSLRLPRPGAVKGKLLVVRFTQGGAGYVFTAVQVTTLTITLGPGQQPLRGLWHPHPQRRRPTRPVHFPVRLHRQRLPRRRPRHVCRRDRRPRLPPQRRHPRRPARPRLRRARQPADTRPGRGGAPRRGESRRPAPAPLTLPYRACSRTSSRPSRSARCAPPTASS